MSHPDTAKMINAQIAVEFEKLNDFMTFESEKPAILARIEQLKAMLDGDEVVEPKTQSNALTAAVDLFRAFRNR